MKFASIHVSHKRETKKSFIKKQTIIWRVDILFLLIMVIAHTPVQLAQIKKLLYAVRTSDYDQVRRICEKGVDGIINYNDPTDGNGI
jgi:uncharacterized membrane protein YvbJ